MVNRTHEVPVSEVGIGPAENMSHRLFLLGEAKSYDALADGLDKRAAVLRQTAEKYRQRAEGMSEVITVQAPTDIEQTLGIYTIGSDIIG